MKFILIALLVATAIAPAAAAAAPGTCVTTLDDMISDGGSTYCVSTTGDCKVSESREFIWGREYYCYV